jgi:TonB family protein
LDDQLEFLIQGQERSWRDGVSWSVILSVVVHIVLVTWVLLNYHPVTSTDKATPMAKYVVMMKQNPQFTEAPGKKIEKAPMNAPYSDANRKASAPQSTGEQPTKRPGDGGPLYTPPMPRGGDGRESGASSPAAAPAQPQYSQQQPSEATPLQQRPEDPFTYRQQTTQAAAAAGPVDWRRALKEVKVASLGTGQEGLDLGSAGGGEKGSVETGPLSFETQWYDWGDYAASMVSRIRVNWIANMPQLLKTGMKGVVTIRFTIHRTGRISDVTIVNSSGAPPYDFAAKKAIELSSPLNALPADFPNESERVTCVFYYNDTPPAR